MVAYLAQEFAREAPADQERVAKEFLSRYGERPRRYRNGIGLAIPDRKPVEALRRAVRYLLATERVEAKKQQLRLTKEQLDQLNAALADAEVRVAVLRASDFRPRPLPPELFDELASLETTPR